MLSVLLLLLLGHSCPTLPPRCLERGPQCSVLLRLGFDPPLTQQIRGDESSLDRKQEPNHQPTIEFDLGLDLCPLLSMLSETNSNWNPIIIVTLFFDTIFYSRSKDQIHKYNNHNYNKIVTQIEESARQGAFLIFLL